MGLFLSLFCDEVRSRSCEWPKPTSEKRSTPPLHRSLGPELSRDSPVPGTLYDEVVTSDKHRTKLAPRNRVSH